MTDTVPARRALLALLLDRIDRDALLPAERPLLRALVTAEQDAADLPKARHWRGTDGADITTAYMDAQATLARVRRAITEAVRCPNHKGFVPCPHDHLVDIAAAFDGPSPTDDDAQAAADRAALDNAIADEMLGLVGLGVATPVDRCRVLPSRTCPPSYGSCGGPCARFESDDPTPWTTPGAEQQTPDDDALSAPCIHLRDGGCCTGPGYCAHACNDERPPCPIQLDDGPCAGIHGHPGNCTTNADDIAVYPATEDAPSPRCTATITGRDRVNPNRIIRCDQPAGHYHPADKPEPMAIPPTTGGWHTATGRSWNDNAEGATPHRDAPSEPQP